MLNPNISEVIIMVEHIVYLNEGCPKCGFHFFEVNLNKKMCKWCGYISDYLPVGDIFKS